VTSDAHLAERIRSLRDHGRAENSKYRHDLVGTNSRLDGLQAVVLTAKLAKLDAWTEARRTIAGQYRAAFANGPVHFVEEAAHARAVYHLAVARVPNRNRVQQQLASMGIQTGIHYPAPCHRQPPYRRFATQSLPVTDQAADEILSLPMFPHMRAEQVARVCEALHEILGAGASHVA